jgi:hypothetical protein
MMREEDSISHTYTYTYTQKDSEEKKKIEIGEKRICEYKRRAITSFYSYMLFLKRKITTVRKWTLL